MRSPNGSSMAANAPLNAAEMQRIYDRPMQKGYADGAEQAAAAR